MSSLIVSLEGDSCVLICRVGGTPESQVIWYKNKNLIPKTNKRYFFHRHTLRIEDLTFYDQGQYTCSVCNKISCVNHVYNLQIFEKPLQSQEFLKSFDYNDLSDDFEESNLRKKRDDEKKAPYFTNPKKMSKFEVKAVGNMIVLKCKASGNPTPNITWYKNNQTPKRHLGEIRYQHWGLWLEDLVTDDTGNYTCVVCNELGCINYTTEVAVFKYHYKKPILIHQTENSTVGVGSSINLTCNFSSDLNPYIQWVRKYTNKSATVVQTSNVVDDPEVLEIHNATDEDEGWYICTAVSSLGKTSAKTYLRVYPKTAAYPRKAPYFVNPEQMPAKKTGSLGSTVVLTCKAEGFPFPNITWYKKEARPKRELDEIPYQHWNLYMKDLVMNDAGNYKCLVCNELDCISHTYEVIIVPKYRLWFAADQNLENYTVAVDSSINLTCSFLSNLKVSTQWKRKYANGSTVLVQKARDTDNPKVYKIRNVSHEDEGWYYCIAATSLARVESKSYLKVVDRSQEESTSDDKRSIRPLLLDIRRKRDDEKKAPYFTNPKKMSKIEVKPAGNMIVLKCKASGNPTPNITWYKNNQTPKRHLGEIRYQHWGLWLEDLVTDDTGNYTCVVCNELGCINFTYEVEVIDGYPQNLTVLVNTTASFECPQMIADLEPFLQWVRLVNASEVNENSTYINGTVLQPVLTHQFENSTVAVGTSINLTCNFLTDLNPYIQWMREYPNTSAIVVQKSGGDTENPEVYEIQNVTYQDEGWYACIAANSLGQTAAKAYLRVVDSIEEEAKVNSKNIITYAAILIIVVLIAIGSIILMEKHKKMIALETVRAAVVTQWTKKVIIEKIQNTTEDVSEP
ncbi:fibroblast growth factor receptor -like 1-like, partial [Asbolus verrucosus]